MDDPAACLESITTVSSYTLLRGRSSQIRDHTDLSPYVYHVQQHDLAGLKNALRSAIATPIGSYVPSYMRFDTIKGHTARVVERGWRSRAEALLEEKKQSGGEVRLSPYKWTSIDISRSLYDLSHDLSHDLYDS